MLVRVQPSPKAAAHNRPREGSGAERGRWERLRAAVRRAQLPSTALHRLPPHLCLVLESLGLSGGRGSAQGAARRLARRRMA